MGGHSGSVKHCPFPNAVGNRKALPRTVSAVRLRDITDGRIESGRKKITKKKKKKTKKKKKKKKKQKKIKKKKSIKKKKKTKKENTKKKKNKKKKKKKNSRMGAQGQQTLLTE